MRNLISCGRLLLLGLVLAGGLSGAVARPGHPSDGLGARWDASVSLDVPEPRSVKSLYRALGDAVGSDVVFDPKLRDSDMALPLKDVRAQDVLDILSLMANHFYKVIDDHTLLIVEDTPQNRRAHEMPPTRPIRPQPPRLNLRSAVPITLDVPEPRSIMGLYRTLGDALGINVLFDPQLRDKEVAVSLKSVRAQDALDSLLRSGEHLSIAIDDHTVLIAEDRPQNRRLYDVP